MHRRKQAPKTDLNLLLLQDDHKWVQEDITHWATQSHVVCRKYKITLAIYMPTFARMDRR